MTLLQLPYITIMTLACVGSLLIAFYAWPRRTTPGGIYFILLMLMVAGWAFTNAAELAAMDIPGKITWSKLSYLPIVAVPPFWLLFALFYSQRGDWISRRKMTLLWLVPALVLGLVFTNEWHGLVWPRVYFMSEVPGSRLIYEHGLGVLIDVIYSYVLLLAGTVLFIRATLRSPQLYRQQVWALVASAAFPWIGNALYITGYSPFPGLDLTPLAFTLTGVLLAWGIFRFRMLDIVPVARDRLIENMNDGVLVLDEHGRIVDINPAACRLIQQPAGRVVGQPAGSVLSAWPDLVERYRNTLEAQIEVCVDAVSTPLWMDIRISPLYDRRKRLTGRLITLHDITRRKLAETTLQEYTQELETRNQELDAFARTVAHDLRNPLSVLMGYSGLLEIQHRKMGPDDIDQKLHLIAQSADKMEHIINEILLLAGVRKIDQVNIQPLNMGRIVSEAKRRLADTIAIYEAILDEPQTWPIAIGYASWIEEVWVNYISNAVKYGGTPPYIKLGFDLPLARPNEANSMIRFWIRDNGAGLTPEARAQLFTEFTRLDQSRAPGYGLGLSIVRRIVEKLGGTVGVDSEIGRGSTFFFTLPMEYEPQE